MGKQDHFCSQQGGDLNSIRWPDAPLRANGRNQSEMPLRAESSTLQIASKLSKDSKHDD